MAIGSTDAVYRDFDVVSWTVATAMLHCDQNICCKHALLTTFQPVRSMPFYLSQTNNRSSIYERQELKFGQVCRVATMILDERELQKMSR
jgi:hypothetical protein